MIHQKERKDFFVGGFTNLCMTIWIIIQLFAEYLDVKKVIFDFFCQNSIALSNGDDKNGAVMLQNTAATKRTYALKSYADYKIILENQLSGLLLKINDNEVWVKLIGTFNAYNLLAIYGLP